ncbi:MAG: DUF6268 family outer membrane beta-barrel protein [Ferruginibacter sp.]
MKGKIKVEIFYYSNTKNNKLPAIIKHTITLLPFFLIVAMQSFAQEAVTKKKAKKVYCKCTINGLPRGKAASLKYEYRPHYNITTTDKTGNFGNSSNTIKNNGRIEAKVKIPIINKPYLSIIGGLKYNREEYNFKALPDGSNPLYKSLEDRDLKSIGANLTVIKPSLSNKFWILRLSANLNGDYSKSPLSKANYLKFSVSPALAWRKNDDLSYAVGLTYSYSFGRSLVFPTFALNYNFNERWSIETILPLFVKFRYGFNEDFYWYNNIEFSAASYRLNNTNAALAAYQSLHLYTSELKVSSSLEKQLVGWLWAGIEIGGAHNFSYNLTNSTSGKKDVIFKSKIKDGLLFNVNLFLVAPKKLYRRLTENL